MSNLSDGNIEAEDTARQAGTTVQMAHRRLVNIRSLRGVEVSTDGGTWSSGARAEEFLRMGEDE